MTPNLIRGDHISCSRVGGAMRRESERLRQRAQSLDDALDHARAAQGPGDTSMAAFTAISTSLEALHASARDLDEAGAALQRYATDLAESHELGRRAQQRVAAAGLLLEGTRVVEPWGPASAADAERRRALLPEVQSRVDLATAQVGRARGRLEREATRLTEGFSAHSRAAHSRAAPSRAAYPAQ